jgi:hypothetical protein
MAQGFQALRLVPVREQEPRQQPVAKPERSAQGLGRPPRQAARMAQGFQARR